MLIVIFAGNVALDPTTLAYFAPYVIVLIGAMLRLFGLTSTLRAAAVATCIALLYTNSTYNMSSPAKKRKRNGTEASPQKNRSIASFFQGQSAKSAPKASPDLVPEPEPEATEQTLSDEALARKLQAEWDQEDKFNASGSLTFSGHRVEDTKLRSGKCSQGRYPFGEI